MSAHGPTRREVLARGAAGLLALGAPRPAERTPRAPAADRLVVVHLRGGPSQVDTFDPKPRLAREHGRPFPLPTPPGEEPPAGRLLASPWRFARHGEAGLAVSELLPALARQADRLCVVRSFVPASAEHAGAARALATGSAVRSAPPLGSLVARELGALERDAPAFAVLGSLPAWSTSSAPPRPCRPVRAPDAGDDPDPRTARLYGLDDPVAAPFGRRLLAARRLLERGARVVHCSHDGGWDHHDGLRTGHARAARQVDRPVAGLLEDLARTGLATRTVVLWAGELGRTPTSRGGDGRDHDPHGATVWLAGAGVRAGTVHGATDDYGYRAVSDPVSVADLHATLLALLGLERERLVHPADGAARVVEGLLEA